MGLLDWMNTPEGVGLLSAVAGGLAGARRGQPINSIGRGLAAGVMGYQGEKDNIQRAAELELANRYRSMQMQDMEQKLAQQKSQQEWKAGLPEMLRNRTQTVAPNENTQLMAGAMGSQAAPEVVDNSQALQDYLMRPDSPYAEKILEQQLFPKADDYKVVGDSVVQIGGNGVKPVYTAQKAPSLPSAVEEYNFARGQGYQGTYADWKASNARAGATNVTNRIENKVGDSIAGQVGPMLKASTEKTTGAINLANSSRLMIEALDKGKAYIGPTANARMKLAQFGQVLGVGGKTEAEKINNTRQLIRSLAEGGVEARKELAGQGQVTESEAAAVQKAYSGNIEDLTAGEVRLIAGLNIKREKLARERHARAMRNAPQELQPFYQVDPEAPANPGGGWGITRVK